MLNIVLIFRDILKSYLVSIYLLILAMLGVTRCYKYLVTMATEAGDSNVAVGKYKNFIFGAHIP